MRHNVTRWRMRASVAVWIRPKWQHAPSRVYDGREPPGSRTVTSAESLHGGDSVALRAGTDGTTQRSVRRSAIVALREATTTPNRFNPEQARLAGQRSAEVRRERKERAERERAAVAAVIDKGVGLPNHSEILEAIRIGLPQLRAIVSDPASKPSEIMDAMRLLGQWAGLTRQSERNVDASPESRLAAAYRARGVEVPEHLRPYDKP